MDIEKLIEQFNRYFEGKELKRGAALDAATALSTLQAENERLRGEVERMKKIMRENGIMVIPSKYPGCPAEWNTPKL